MRHVIVTSLLLAVPALAQEGTTLSGGPGTPGKDVPAAFQNYGSGCAGSGLGLGAKAIVPSAVAASFGNTNNNIPFSWQPTRYQQVFLGSELGSPLPFVALQLRQDDQFSNFDAHKVDLAIWLGGSTYDHNSITNTFDGNFNSTAAPKTLVFKQRNYSFPKMPPANPTNPADFFITFPFDAPYVLTLASGENMVIEVINYGNTNGNQLFTYPLDAHSSTTTTRLYASGNPTATTGTLGRGYGHVMAFAQLGGATQPLHIQNSNTPKIGTDFHFELLHARGNAPGVMIAGTSNTNSGGIPLPFSLASLGAPGCSLLASTTITLPIMTNAGGDLALTLSIPSNPALDGFNLFLQFAVTDTVNALGLVTSDGGQLTIGS